MREEAFARFKLFAYGRVLVAVRRVERVVVAKGASSAAYATVAVGAGEACVDRNLLHLVREA